MLNKLFARASFLALLYFLVTPFVVVCEAEEHFLMTAPRGQWIEIPNSHLAGVLPKKSFEQPIRKIVGPGAIVGAWSGGAYDTKRNRLMIFGGGHADYCGNEWLAFDLDDLRWQLLSGPSDLTGYDDQSGMTPDGNPASRHTYNGLAYIPTTDEFLVHGGSLCNGAGSADNRWWIGNPEDGSWQYQGGKGTWLLGYSMAYDRVTDKVYESRRGPLFSYNPSNDKWVKLTKKYGDVGRSGLTGVIDPKRRKFLLMGQGMMFVYDLKSYERAVISADKNIPVISANAPGLEFVESIDRYVAWAGGKTIYLIHPVTWTISVIKTSGLEPKAGKRGTYGRFRYSTKYDGFVLVNGINNNVYFLKPPLNIENAKLVKVVPKHTVINSKTIDKKVIKSQSPAIVNVVTPHSDWPVKFGAVWCPEKQNQGFGFKKILNHGQLPNDPIGDGENNCYMEAFDTSVFSTDNLPVQSCQNLNIKKFPGHRCKDIRTKQDFKNIAFSKNLVAVITNDLEVEKTFEPYISSNQKSRIIIGAYNPKTKRPILIKDRKPGPSTYFNWNSKADNSSLTLINLRLHSSGLCVQVPSIGAAITFSAVSVTAKCKGRFLMAGREKTNSKNKKVDNRFYLKNVMARSKNSHTVYMDRTYLNWVEDSILMGPWLGGKHAAKYTGQNVVVRNSLHSNQGTHGIPVVDPEYFDEKRPGLGKGGLAPVSMASCNRAVIDGVTVINHAVWGNSNPQSIQWQFRDGLGAGCDLPKAYIGPNPHKAYRGPVWHKGEWLEKSPVWSKTFWKTPEMLESYVVNSQVVQTYDRHSKKTRHFALMSDGTYPSVRDNSSSPRRAADEIPPGWKERQRIHVSGNCLNNGIANDSVFSNHKPRGMGKHKYDNTNRFVLYGENRCENREKVDSSAFAAMTVFLESLPPPPWQAW